MVHLSKVPNDADLSTTLHGLDKLQVSQSIEDEITSSVYGSRFAAQELPKHEMPEEEMPREVAYRMIKFVAAINAASNGSVVVTA